MTSLGSIDKNAPWCSYEGHIIMQCFIHWYARYLYDVVLSVCVFPPKVELWLNRVLDTMRSTIRHEMTEAVLAYEDKPREQWLFDYPAQVTSTGGDGLMYLNFTNDIKILHWSVCLQSKRPEMCTVYRDIIYPSCQCSYQWLFDYAAQALVADDGGCIQIIYMVVNSKMIVYPYMFHKIQR